MKLSLAGAGIFFVALSYSEQPHANGVFLTAWLGGIALQLLALNTLIFAR